ncbi:4-coumarate--CoA ligase-like 6 [Apium graveolens]|uniref:4-coumarate--CoA ligase-like 6 n=1 Tax=Apium graveolens TaxID=4045 RepID=UPI003D79AC59
MIETEGAATTMSDQEESKRYGSAGHLAANMQGKIVDLDTGEALPLGQRYGSAGRLAVNMQGKIVDLDTGDALPLGQQGELWLQGPNIMKGYVGDNAATAETLTSDGWLKTGRLRWILVYC